MNFKNAPHIQKSELFLPIQDIFELFGFKHNYDSARNISSYISSSSFFTIDNKTNALKLNGQAVKVNIKTVDGIPYILSSDIPRLLPVKITSKDTKSIHITTDFKSNVIVRYGNKKIFELLGSYYFTNPNFYVGSNGLQSILLDSVVIENDDSFTVKSPIDGSDATFYFDGSIKYTVSGSEKVISLKADPNKLFNTNQTTNNKRINIEYINLYTSYSVKFYADNERRKIIVEIGVPWHDLDFVIIEDDKIPLANLPALKKVWPAPTVDKNPPVADTGYILNTELADKIAIEINLCRAKYKVPVIPVNHSLIYKPQASKNPLNNTVFDNLRWCRENLSNRQLIHVNSVEGDGEVLVLGATSVYTASKVVTAWYNSMPHRIVILHKDMIEFGVVAIQYPNGDVDIAGIFTMGLD